MRIPTERHDTEAQDSETFGDPLGGFVNCEGDQLNHHDEDGCGECCKDELDQQGSSIRLKKNIRPLEGALEKVLHLNGVYFTWKESGKEDLGFIAEEVGKVIPEAVTYEEDGEYASGMSYDHVIPVLVEAVKEQQALIDRQAEALDALAQRLEKLEALLASRNGTPA